MPDERWKPLIGTPSKPPIPSDILVPDPSPARSLISDAESPTLLPPSPGGSFVHRRRQGQYVPRPPIWKIHDYEEACEDTYNAGEVGSSLQEESTDYNWPLQLPGIDQGQLMADVFNSQPLIVNMMTSHGAEQLPEYQDAMATTAASQACPGPMQSDSLLTSEQTHEKSRNKTNAGGGPVDGGSPLNKNIAPVSTRSASTSELSEKALDQLHATIFTNPDPFAPKPQRPVRTYSPQVSPKTKDPFRMYPSDEAQVVDIDGVPPPRIKDHLSLISGGKSFADPGSANNEAVIPPSSREGPTKSSPQITSMNRLPKRIARLFTVRPGVELRRALKAPVVVDEGATDSNRSGNRAADYETSVPNSKSENAAQSKKRKRAEEQKRTSQSRTVQLPTVTIPLQTVPLKVHVHVSDVPESQYLEAKIISAQPYYPPTEELSISSTLARFRSLVQAQEGRQSTLGFSNEEKVSRKQTAGDRGADESPARGTQNEAVPVEMSGALAQDSRRPRGTMLKTLRKSIGRSFKSSKLFSKHSDPGTSGKPENVASSEDDHERTLSALRGTIPRFPPSEEELPNIPGIRGPRTPEPRSDHVPSGGSPASWAAIQSNANMIETQTPSRPVNRWVRAQRSARSSEDGDSSSQPMNSRAGNAERVSQPRQVVQSPTVEGSVSGRSKKRPTSPSNNDGAPAGDWAFGRTSNPSSTLDHQPRHESENRRDQISAEFDGSDTIRAPPRVMRPIPIRPKKAKKENKQYGDTGFGGTAPSA